MESISTAFVSSLEVATGMERIPVQPNDPLSVQMACSPSSKSGRTHHKSRVARGLGPVEMGSPGYHRDKFRRRQAKKEILRRALTPQPRRLTLRWLDFRPTPSRLRFMSLE